MERIVVYEDAHASIVYGHNPVALGHLKIYPKVKVTMLEELPAKTIAHLFSLATRCASLLFDGLQAQGTNIILNEGKNANQLDDNMCIDVIARAEKDELSFIWQPKQGDMNSVKQIASEISSKIVVYEKPPEPVVATPPVAPQPKVTKVDAEPIIIKEEPSPEEFGMEVVTNVEATPRDEPVNDGSMQPGNKKPVVASATPKAIPPKSNRVTDEEFDKKTNFLYYELMRMP